MNATVVVLCVVSAIAVFLIIIISLYYCRNKQIIFLKPGGVTPAERNNENSYTIQFINESPQVLLLGAYGPKLPISTRTNVWSIKPNESVTVDIPNEWIGQHYDENPKFWARTGCRFDSEFAQCESGNCQNFYTCKTLPSIPTSLAEFCFECDMDHNVRYLVDLSTGYNLSINIKPVILEETSESKQGPHWNIREQCDANGNDLRALCPESHQLLAKELSSFIKTNNEKTIVGCFSNCGRALYPIEPEPGETRYEDWKKYCCGGNQNKTCQKKCQEGTVCWNKMCECHGWTIEKKCPTSLCTYASEQPPHKQCVDCVGDDTFHLICPNAKSWKNDPQYGLSKAKVYQVIFSEGGTHVEVTPASNIPKCSALPVEDYNKLVKKCMTVGSSVNKKHDEDVISITTTVMKNEEKYALIRKNDVTCNVRDSDEQLGILCRWT